MPNKASIAIFYKSLDYSDAVSKPFVSDDIFIAAKRVIKNKSTEIVQTRDGTYVVSYSKSGPFVDTLPREWLPVRVIRLKQWHSGGITENELKQFEESNNAEQNPKPNS